MKNLIIYCVLAILVSCKEEPPPPVEEWVNDIKTPENLKNYLVGDWVKGFGAKNYELSFALSDSMIVTYNHEVIERLIDQDVAIFNAFDLDSIEINRSFAGFDSLSFVNVLGLPPEDWDPWLANWNYSRNKIIIYSRDSMEIIDFEPWPLHGYWATQIFVRVK